jgi:predicted ribosomally synthesized peptide with SipW-like signal peptide
VELLTCAASFITAAGKSFRGGMYKRTKAFGNSGRLNTLEEFLRNITYLQFEGGKEKMKKIKWIMLALVLCLGLVGGAYAAWSETMEIDGTIHTAEFDVYLSNLETEVAGAHNDLKNGTNIAGFESSISDDKLTINFEVSNVFPGYFVGEEFDIVNNSSIPVYVKSIDTSDVPPEILFQLQNVWGAGDVINAKTTKNAFYQISVLNTVEPNRDYNFTVTFVIEQLGHSNWQ